jgi:hypothetical protein
LSRPSFPRDRQTTRARSKKVGIKSNVKSVF